MRISTGSVKQTTNGGFLHVLNSGFHSESKCISVEKRSPAEIALQMQKFQAAINLPKLGGLAENLGVTAASLIRLRIGWSISHRAWAFPMFDADENVRGIRFRQNDGMKFALKGGHEGLFIPTELPAVDLNKSANSPPILITEGPTDCAALLDLGFPAIGRPSCTGGMKFLVDWFWKYRPAEVVIVADCDGPGQRGAESLACAVLPHISILRVICPPGGIKDVRDWKRAGATRQDVLNVIEAAPHRQLRIKSRIVRATGGRHGI